MFKQIPFLLDAPGAGCTDILLTPEQYMSRPHVDQEIERQYFSGAELLKRGTTMLYSGQKVVSPLLAKETEENDIKNASQTTSVNSENIQIGNSRYAMEGPLTTNIRTSTHPPNKRSLTYSDSIYAGNLEKDERELFVCVESATPTQKTSVHGSSNNDSLKLESKEPSALAKVPEKSTSISSSNEVERSLVKLKDCPPDNSKRYNVVVPGVCAKNSVKSHDTPEKLNKMSSWWKSDVLNAQGADDDDRFTHTATSRATGFDLDNRLSVDGTNSSARTRVYHRKSNSRKQQRDLSPEKKLRRLGRPTADQSEEKESKSLEHRCQLVNTPVVGKSVSSRRKQKKVRLSDPHPRKLFLSTS